MTRQLSHRWRGRLALFLIAFIGAFLAHRSQRAVDEIRYQHGAWDSDRLRPSGPTLRTAAMGYHTVLADFMWIRTVLVVSDIYDEPDPGQVVWLRENLLAISVLDPNWRTLYFYGGGFLRVTEDIEGSNQLFELGMKHLPEDPYFPFSRGMNAYLHPDPDDPEGSIAEAAEYMRQASELPGAPAWYKGNVAIFLDQAEQRSRALKYLEDQIAVETRPRAQEILWVRWAELKHDELVQEMETKREEYRAAMGRPLRDPHQLGQLAADPLGGTWIIGPDGEIRSTEREAVLKEKARLLERGMLTREARAARSPKP